MRHFAMLILTAFLSSGLYAASEAPPVVTKLRLQRVFKFDMPRGTPVGEMLKTDYVPNSWTVVGVPEAGFILVKEKDTTFYVKSTAIDTDRRIASSAECGVKVGGRVEKIGATRALGEECQ